MLLFAVRCASAATQMGDYLPGDGSAVTPDMQEKAAEALALGGVDAADARTALVGGSGGTFLNAASTIVHQGGSLGTAMRKVMSATGRDGLAAVRIASGATAVAGVNASAATIGAIAGRGGVVQQRFASLMAERRDLRSLFGSDAALAIDRMNADLMKRVWASPFYTYQKMDAKDGYAAYSYKAGGLALGADRAFGPVTAGAALTYSRGDYSEKGIQDDNTVINYGLSLYGNYSSCSGFFASVYGGYNYAKNDLRQYEPANQAWQSGKNHTRSLWLGGEIGYDIPLGESFGLAPSAGLLWSKAAGSRYAIKGPLPAEVDRITDRGLLLPVDLAVTYTAIVGEGATVQFKAGAGYAYNFRNDGASGSMRYGDSAVLIQGVKPGRHSWNAGAGVRFIRDRLDVGVDYRYVGKEKYDDHRVSATIGLHF